MVVSSGSAIAVPKVMPTSQSQATPAQPAASASPAASSGFGLFSAASVAPASSGIVKAESFLTNLWSQVFGPMLSGLWNAISSIFSSL